MRKIVAFAMALTMVITISACGAQKSDTIYHVGDTVSTDVVEFTLDNAALALALENTMDENYGLPKDYDATEDAQNPYVAPTGTTFAAYGYTLKNLDRSSRTVSLQGENVNVELDGKNYDLNSYDGQEWYEKNIKEVARYLYEENLVLTNGQQVVENAGEWMSTDLDSILLDSEQKESRRGYLVLPVETDNLDEAFYITFTLPTSDGEEIFTYQVNA